MKRFLLSSLCFLCAGCCFSPLVQQRVFLDYSVNQKNEASFSISEKSLTHLRRKGIQAILSPQPLDLKKLCPKCQLNINNPTIGVLLARSDKDAKSYAITGDYIYALIKAGANVRFISYDNVAYQNQNLDGILLPGGTFPSQGKWYFSYGQKKFEKPQKRYYAYESLIKHAQKNQIPLLGICAGMQMMSALLSNEKIKMFDNLEEVSDLPHKKLDRYQRAHKITVQPDTTLFSILKTNSLGVNSRHRVGVALETTNIPEVTVSALSPDGIVEAIEFSSHPTALGVQFHPEVFANQDDPQMQKIFDWFVGNARIYQQQRKEK